MQLTNPYIWYMILEEVQMSILKVLDRVTDEIAFWLLVFILAWLGCNTIGAANALFLTITREHIHALV